MRNGCWADPIYFESELSFILKEIENLQNYQSDFLKRRHAVLLERGAEKTAQKAQ
jgi:hypothetical protein